MVALVLSSTLLAAVAAAEAPVPAPGVTPEQLATFARQALAGEPEATVEDAYKWLYQAARGGEHAAPSEEAARAWLEREWAGLGASPRDEPLVVPLRPDGAVVRLNLRPYRASGGDRELLLRAFLASARAFRGDAALFVAAWRAYGRLLPADGEPGKDARAFAEVDRASERAGWPARHHSGAYAAARVPAYRVLTGEAAAPLVAAAGGAR